MRAQHHRPLFAHLADELADGHSLVRVEALRRLVHDEDVRLVQNRPCKARPLAIALRARAHGLVEDFLDARLVDGHGDVLPPLGPRKPTEVGHVVEVLLHQQVAVQRVVLRQVADHRPRLFVVLLVVKPLDEYPARIGRVERRDQAHGRALARTVRPQETEDLPPLHVERHVVHRDVRAELLGHAHDLHGEVLRAAAAVLPRRLRGFACLRRHSRMFSVAAPARGRFAGLPSHCSINANRTRGLARRSRDKRM